MFKVIFLDNDGVICLDNNWESRFEKIKKSEFKFINDPNLPVDLRFDNFDKGAVDVLNSILEETGAEIVVSSDWRFHANLEELGDYYEDQDIIKRPIDVTEKFHFTNWLEEGFIKDHGDFPWNRQEDLEQQRHFEIKRWLRDHTEVTHWVAIDDLHMGVHVENSSYGPFDREGWGLENFVWTPRQNEGIKQSGVKDKILKFLL